MKKHTIYIRRAAPELAQMVMNILERMKLPVSAIAEADNVFHFYYNEHFNQKVVWALEEIIVGLFHYCKEL